MLFDPDNHDLVITVLKFLAVVSSGVLTGEAFCMSTTHLPSILSEASDVDVPLRNFRHFCPKSFYMYQVTLVAMFAALGVFVLEVRERFMWLYGALALLAIFLYTKFCLLPYITDLDISNKDKRQLHDMLARFHRYHYLRTFVAFLSFTWLIYSLYVS